MAIRSEQAELVLAVTNKASKELAKIEAMLKQLTTTTETTTTAGKDLETGMTQMGRSMLAAAAPALSLALAIRGIREAWEFAAAGIDDRRIDARFEALAGGAQAAAERMRGLRQASDGVVENTELARASILLDRIGIKALDAQRAVIGFARQYAKENNQSLVEVQKQLAIALKTGEARALSRFGIMVPDKQVLAEFAAAEGIAVEALTKGQRAAALKAAAVAEMAARVQYATREVTAMEEASAAWANAVSDMQRAWADFLDPVAAARAQGTGAGLGAGGILRAALGGTPEQLRAEIEAMAVGVDALLDRRAELLQQAAEARAVPVRFAGDQPMLAETTIAESLEAEAAKIDGALDGLRTDLGQRRIEIQEGLTSLQTALDGFAAKGAPLGQQFGQAFREVAASAESLKAMGQLAAAVGWTGIAQDLSGLESQALKAKAALAEIMRQQVAVQQMDLSGYRAMQRELEALTTLGSRATEADRERAVELKAMAAYYQELHGQALKAVGALDQWVNTANGSLTATKALTEAQAAFAEANKIATTGQGDLAAALARTEAALPGLAAALRQQGMAQSEVNLVLDAAGQKLAFLRQGLDAYLRSLENLPGVVAPVSLGLDPEALRKAQEAARKAFPTEGGTAGAAPQDATQELLTRARIARGEIQSEVAQALALQQAALADLERRNLTARALEAERVLIMADTQAQLAEIQQREQASQDAANMAYLDGLWQTQRQAAAMADALEDERLRQLAAMGIDTQALAAQLQIQRDLEAGIIDERVANQRRLTAEMEQQHAAQQRSLEAYRDAFVNASYAINDAAWKVNQSQETDQEIQDMQRKAAALSAVGGDLARSGFEIAAASQAQANADREAATERERLTQLQQAGQAESQQAAQTAQQLQALQQASRAASTSMNLGIAGAIQGVGGLLGVFAGGAREAAAVMAAFSAAAAAFAFATPGGQLQGAQYALAAAMFAAIALTPTSKKKSSTPEIASQGLAAPTQRGGDINININLTEGVVYGDPGQIGENIIRAIKGAEYGSARIPRGLIG